MRFSIDKTFYNSHLQQSCFAGLPGTVNDYNISRLKNVTILIKLLLKLNVKGIDEDEDEDNYQDSYRGHYSPPTD
ncbi:MAG: hypothetical protein ISS18_10910 [Bacteroidales bacterium]|nr:hypothetical protein [Bacteroidales bacterium]